MKKTKRKVAGSSKKAKLTPMEAWFGNPLFVAAVVMILAVVVFILADDWLSLQSVVR